MAVGIVRKPKSESGRARVAHPRKAKATEFGLKDLASLNGFKSEMDQKNFRASVIVVVIVVSRHDGAVHEPLSMQISKLQTTAIYAALFRVAGGWRGRRYVGIDMLWDVSQNHSVLLADRI